jgi:serine/threonine protein phosphatase PrpC
VTDVGLRRRRNEDAFAIEALPQGAARRLLRAALDAGGRDNVTAAVIPCPPPVGERGR